MLYLDRADPRSLALVLALSLSLTLCAGPLGAQAQTLNDVLHARERALRRLGARAASLYGDRCAAMRTCTVSECSLNACGNEFPGSRGFTCNNDFGQNPSLCGQTCGGMIRSMNATVNLYPSGSSLGDADLQAFTCSTKAMTEEFKREYDQGHARAWEYIGHTSGSIRIYPGVSQGRTGRSSCADYDARLRPWYIAASSGPKDVVLVIDASGSMEGTRMDATKAAVADLLTSLTQNDRVAVVTFNAVGTVIGSSNKLIRTTPSNVAALISAVQQIEATGGTSFLAGLIEAFAVLQRSVNDETRNCNTVILFLTDGQTSDSATELLTSIDTAQTQFVAAQGANGRRAVIFTYSMGSGADRVKPRLIACANEGVWDQIADGVDPLTRMRGYFAYIAAGLNTDVVRWSSVYTDALGLGQMVTAALPVYETFNGLSRVVNVVGMDVTLAELSQFGDSVPTVISALYARSSVCTAFSLSECERQYLRSLSPSGYVCPDQRTVSSCTQTSNDVVPVSTCTGLSGGLNSALCDAMRNNQDRLTSDGIAYTTAESQCCFSCLNSNGVVTGQTGTGRVGVGAPNTPSGAAGASLAASIAAVLVLLFLV